MHDRHERRIIAIVVARAVFGRQVGGLLILVLMGIRASSGIETGGCNYGLSSPGPDRANLPLRVSKSLGFGGVIDQATAGIRQAGPADAPAIRELTRAAYAKWVPGREPKPRLATCEEEAGSGMMDGFEAEEIQTGETSIFVHRAAATLDREHDKADDRDGRRIACPLLALWSAQGGLNSWYADAGGPLALWRTLSDDVQGQPLDGGHFFPEEFPEQTAEALNRFFATSNSSR